MNATTTHTQAVNSQSTNNCHIEDKVFWSQNDIHELKHGMLTLALEELRDNRKSKKMKQEAWEWLMSEEDSSHTFSAENCCFEIGADIENLRSMLTKMLETGVIKL